MAYENLFSPLKIGKNLTVKNRYVLAPMGLGGNNFYSFDAKGCFSEEAIDYFTGYARGGFGLLMTGALAADTEIDGIDRFTRLAPAFSQKHFIQAAAQLTDRVHAYGAHIFAQLSLGVGRNGAPGLKSASENPYFFTPDQMTESLCTEEIARKVEQEVEAARRCQLAGFDGVEVHALHMGYLLDQFAMAVTNRRDDQYGGSLENRLRICREVIQGIRAVCGADFPVSMRLGLKSYLNYLGPDGGSLDGENETGRTLEEGVRIAQLLESYGYDLLSCDAGLYESFYHTCPPMYLPKGNYVELAAAAKKVVKIPVLLAGRMDDPALCEDAIREGKIDGVVLGRSALADPAYPLKVMTGREKEIRPCIACCQCLDASHQLRGCSGCTVNPAHSRELNYGLRPALQPKKVAVIGGGPAGMEAAAIARQCGHEVVLFEKETKLGGNLIPASAHDFKKDLEVLTRYLEQELVKNHVEIRLGTEADAQTIRETGADAAILATGSVPFLPHIPGDEEGKAVSCLDVLSGGKQVGQRVLIAGGGLIGCEMAIAMAREGKEVCIVEALDDILSSGARVPLMQEMMIRKLLQKYKVRILTGRRLAEITAEGALLISSATGNDQLCVCADHVILALGFRPAPQPELEKELLAAGIPVYTIGDARKTGNIQSAIWDAYEVARSL
ncbi:MAG: FAD-dependent oxidoreductase [Firmicutes bacterium]|nr:FAD-dependent oxidoreductase [Bacillota bacterium]